MQRIEDIIKKNREAFSDQEPPEGHFGRFSEKLAADHQHRESWMERNAIALRIAAALLLFVAISTLIYTDKLPGIKSMFTTRIASAQLPREFIEVMQYYNILTDKKVGQIDELASSTDEATRIKQKAKTELEELDKAKNDLESEYAQNPNSERILNALMLNQQKRAKILDKIINTLNQTN
jgi:hypothetical protein